MPSIYSLKPRFQNFLRPMVAGLARAGVTANQITLLALLLSIAVGALLFFARTPLTWLILPAFLFVRMALNAMDGMLAREFGQQSPLGAILNEIGDVLADTALFLPFLLIAPDAVPWLLAVIFLALLSEFAGLLGPLLGASRRYDGPMGKSDRALVFGAFALAYALHPAAAHVAEWVFAVVSLLLALTVIKRCCAMLAEVAHAQ
ncbi:CDP-alcohol phosphatidyltransferase family protein [Chitinilyticum litopenaei]|uniref:CDP-alcohol phosphatidyltransferase family protein n=1 Tax=Chitinilyticum litopenaei TaxID=1121276 RepID=UPI000491E5FF|nr:CDP-alcohol phosphatidyltransferase family protein [Chitinilyticum litopenaei]